MFGAEDVATLDSLIKENNIRYIIVDYSVRTNETYVVREDIISSAYECVYTNGDEGDWAMNIYDTSRRLYNE
jgi:ABC-type Zn uptake system ZnuABC Zn-binding protein ZnuA